MYKPAKSYIYTLYREVKESLGIPRKEACEEMSKSTGTSAETVDKWISGKSSCSAGYWRLLNLDFRGIDLKDGESYENH